MEPPAEAPAPPTTRREVVSETVHGTEISDPYRWLEADDEAVREWVDAQNQYADAHLDTPTREKLRPTMRELTGVPDYGPIKTENGRYFQMVRKSDDDHSKLSVRKSPDADGTVLVDPNEWHANTDEDTPPRSLNWFLPSYDGEHVAYGVTEGGDEQVDIHVVTVPDAEEVAVLEDCGRVYLGVISYDAVSPGMVAWDADSAGLYYVATGSADSGAQMEKELRHWRIDGDERTVLEHDDHHVWPTVETDPESGTVAVGYHDVSGTDWYVVIDDALQPVVTDSDAETFVTFHDETAFVLTDHDAPRKRLLACPLSQFRSGDLEVEECETVLPERDALLQSFATTPDHIVAQYLTDAHARLAVHDHDGDHVRDLPLPDYASVSHLRSDGDAEAVFYQVESFHHPPTLVRADPATGDHRELATVDVETPEGLVVEQAFVESTDGAEVPVFVCHRADIERDGDNPAVLSGYGGFRSNRPPSFDRFRIPFLADGGVYAQVCARGGQEYGEAWHEDGMLADKQHTFDDFIAAGEFLCAADYTNPDRLAVVGRSNGGLSVGAVVTQRPDLWTAARCSVPLLDMLRFHRFLLGESWTTEYGHPDDSDAFEYIREYSPYHNIERGVDHPAVLFTTAAEDTRVHPAHARKMAARMQHEAGGGPFLLQTKIDTGHGSGKTTSMLLGEQIDEWTFLYDHLGMGE
ncbi:prolyl oligopeptidase family serine peptidase [Haladaptatus sp. DFWS20]|uniref:prolyl oligopeptidase family serine peptidase n=1 Tax=Haladaptatus sp. DFWS20 TaxID=3403467 RepID=UPI003EBC67AD